MINFHVKENYQKVQVEGKICN